MLKPNLEQKVAVKQQQQKSFHDSHCRDCTFLEGEKVFAKNYLKGKKWLPGSSIKKTGPVSYKVLLETGRIICCHQDQIRRCFIDETVTTKEQPLLTDDDLTML